MSWYVNYYIGYRTKDGKIYPLGPFDSFGKLKSILTRSRSFASDLWEDFRSVSLKDTTDELRKYFYLRKYYLDEGGDTEQLWCFWLGVNELPSEDYLKKGYFLQEEISQYENNDEDWDYPYHCLSPSEYARKLESELKFGSPKPEKDMEGNEIEVHSCSDYSFYVYPDYSSPEYESFIIRRALDMFEYSEIPEGAEMIILQDNG